MADPKVVLGKCKAAALELNKRLKKYQQGLDALSSDGEITEAKIKKREVKLDDARAKADAALKEMQAFLNGQFKKDHASADDAGKAQMDAWKKQVEKLLASMGKMMHIRNLLPVASAFYE